MSTSSKNSKHTGLGVKDLLFIGFYTIVLIIVVFRHELSHDEAQAWNIARSSKSIFDTVTHSLYEGHTPFWFAVLWPFTYTGNPVLMQFLSALIIVAFATLLLRDKPFPWPVCLLLLLGYFPFYEYAIIPRPYTLAALFCGILATCLYRDNTWFLLLISLCCAIGFTSAFGLVISGPLALLICWNTWKSKSVGIVKLIVGMSIYSAVAILTLYLVIFPIEDHVYAASKVAGESIGRNSVLRPFVTAVLPHFDRLPADLGLFLTTTSVGSTLTYLWAIIVCTSVGMLLTHQIPALVAWVLALVGIALAVQVSGSLSERHLGMLYVVAVTLIWGTRQYSNDRLSSISASNENSFRGFCNLLANLALILTLVFHLAIGIAVAAVDVRGSMTPWKELSSYLEEKLPQHNILTFDRLDTIAAAAYVDKEFYDWKCQCWTRYANWKNHQSNVDRDEFYDVWCQVSAERGPIVALVTRVDWAPDSRLKLEKSFSKGFREPYSPKNISRLYTLSDIGTKYCGLD